MEALPPPERLVLSEAPAENWTKFRQRMELYFKATTTTPQRTKAQKAAIFLHVAGQEAIDVFNTFQLTNEQREDYDVIVQKFEEYCSPKRNETYERYVFRTRLQLEDEPFEQFLRDVQLKSQYCNFGELKNSMVRDPLVCGTKDSKLRARLLREGNLTLEKAIEYCKTAEIVESQNQTWEHSEAQLNAVRKKQREPKSSPKKESMYCGRKHPPRTCPAWGKTCGVCHKKSHFAACCKARKSVQQVDYHNAPQEQTEESDDEFQVLVVSVNDVSRNSEWVIATKLANHDTKLKVDTGAQANLLPHSLVLKLGKTATTRPSATVLTGYDGGVIKHFGVVTLPLRIGEIEERTDFFVVKKGKQALLGLETCERFGLISRAQCLQVQGHLESRIVSDFHSCFQVWGCKETCSLRVEEGATPVALPARRVPYYIREPMRAELARMERHGIIEKVEEPSDWYVAGKDLQLADALSRIAGSDKSASEHDADDVTIHATSVLNTLVSPAMMYRLAEETKADDDLRTTASHSVVFINRTESRSDVRDSFATPCCNRILRLSGRG
ncbi:uncharacterized protein LOC119382232 [Rhipicephalus sanguineus]|uniref:uncharacterized protein LOC119382232 n=1 Tax=Rhipicephalus sanguineus TaxID=34632 RepID=UPI0020C2036E|nr:uncharacterized protein LOC119382232 [Rhipicephalus sanguineus]